MGNLFFGGLLIAGGLGFAFAALVAGRNRPPSRAHGPDAPENASYHRKARLPLFLFGILFALFGLFIMAFK